MNQYRTKSRHLPATSEYEPQIVAPSHPLRSRRGSLVYPHRDLLRLKIGGGVHQCHWCERRIEWRAAFLPRWVAVTVDAEGRYRADIDLTAEQRPQELTTDHRDGNPRNNRASNLLPACRACNMRRALVGNPIFFGKRTRTEFVSDRQALADRLCRSLQLIRETRSRLMSVLHRLIPRLRTDENPMNDDYETTSDRSMRSPPAPLCQHEVRHFPARNY